MNFRNLIFLSSVFLYSVYSNANDLPIWDKSDGPEAFFAKLANERASFPEQNWSTWKAIGQLEKPLEERLVDLAPGSSLLALSYMDLFFSFGKGVRQPLPKAMPSDVSLRNDLHQAIETLPENVKKLLSPYLAAIIPITNVPVNGLAALVLDEQQIQRGGISYLNVDRLNKKMNDWWTAKEFSTYATNANDRFALDAEIDPNPVHNTRVMAIQFILIHELGHILAYGINAFPRWDILPTTYNVGDYPYIDISWEQKNGMEVLNNAQMSAFGAFAGKLVYFKDSNSLKKLTNSDLPGVFKSLQNSSFITPYSTIDPHEDFADFFALYILINTLKLKPSFTVKDSNGSILHKYKLYESIYESRFDSKRIFVENILSQI